MKKLLKLITLTALLSHPSLANEYDLLVEHVESNFTPVVLSRTSTAIANICYYQDSPEKYLTVSFKRDKNKKYIFSGFSKQDWTNIQNAASLHEAYREIITKKEKHQVRLYSVKQLIAKLPN